jgi:hypothetical protein
MHEIQKVWKHFSNCHPNMRHNGHSSLPCASSIQPITSNTSEKDAPIQTSATMIAARFEIPPQNTSYPTLLIYTAPGDPIPLPLLTVGIPLAQLDQSVDSRTGWVLML